MDTTNHRPAPDAGPDLPRIALAGNPNAGKTTIFNAITGARQRVGNYPGVTVERREGDARHRGRRLRVIDLPGIYSLAAQSPDERVAREVLLTERPDVVIQVVDAGNLERNLYLTTQLLEMKTPLVLAFNMMDEVEHKGTRIDREQLAQLLGAAIVPTVGSREEGIAELLDAAIATADAGQRPKVEVRYGSELDAAVAAIQSALPTGDDAGPDWRWLAVNLLGGDGQAERWAAQAGAETALAKARSERARIKGLLGDDAGVLLADARYGWVRGALAETVRLRAGEGRTTTDRVDAVLAHRVLGLPIFLLLMWLTFAATFKLGKPAMELVERAVALTGSAVSAAMPAGHEELRSLMVDGVINGVGGVLVFLPSIMILFLMVALMEDSGYMARAAFIVDRAMHLVGLHGKSFIPLFIGFGCNVPAIMAARALENKRDRITTILVVPFMSCSARLPVYVLLAGAFFPRAQATVVMSLYLLGIAVALVMARLLRTYVVAGPPTPFVMELPPYRLPTPKALLIHVAERAWLYLKKAGTIILAFSIAVWFLSSYPRGAAAPGTLERLAGSYAGTYGRLIAPALRPIGLGDWRIGVTLTTGLAAKEIVISTLSTLYSLDRDPAGSPSGANPAEARTQALRDRIAADGFLTPLRAYALMTFILLYVPCLATIAVARRELGSWKWTALMIAMTVSVAYLTAGAVYWLGVLLGAGE
jgi:ferrous iron transport protein B